MRQRYVIIVNLLNGRSARATAEVLQVHNTTIYRVLDRFQAYGEAGLADQSRRPHGSPGRTTPEMEQQVSVDSGEPV